MWMSLCKKGEYLRFGNRVGMRKIGRNIVMQFKDKLPEEWMLSYLVQIFKGKGDPLNPNSYKGIKLLEHAFKL